MVQMIVDELNEAYDTFVEKHPDFNGKISVFALSLGGIAMFDILTCQDDDNEEEAEKETLQAIITKMMTLIKRQCASKGTQKSQFGQKCKKSNKGDNVKIRKQDEPKFLRKIPKLKFRPHYLFTVGSPLGAVLVMRNLDWETFHPPDDIIHHNLFHPFDPLGYRIEPLIDPIFAKVPAVLMNSYSSSQGALFSLPSLPSLLLPGSISSFWENKVPTLPRPSIPTLSSLSQMTMSLKAGRWLAGNVNTNTNSSNGSNKDEEDDEDGPAATRNDDEVEQRTGEEVQAISFSSSSAAATVATCLAPRETGETSTSTSSPADIDTTTGSPSPATLSAKQRPTLGPRRVSSRVDGQHSREHEQRVMADAAEEDMRNVLSGNSNSRTERGATVQEKAQGVGAKSNVVQEPMVQSISSAQGRTKNKEDEDHQQPHADTFPQEIENVEAAKQQEQKKDRTVHVEGKATKLPYRIDYVLQESTADQYTNEYLLGMRSHFRYWGNRDVAYHILRTMLQPVKNLGSEDEVLDLKLTTPVSSTSAANTKGGVEVKTRLPAATARSRSESSASTMMNATTATEAAAAVSSSFSTSKTAGQKEASSEIIHVLVLWGYDHSSSSDDDDDDERKRTDNQEEQQRRRRRQQQEETDQNMAMMDEENQLFGYRYPRTETDMDMDMDMSIGSDGKDNSNNSSADTYQRTSSSARPRLVSKTYSVEPSEDVSMASINRGSKRRMSSLTRNRRSIDSKEFEAVVETENKAETKAGVAEKAVGVQGWIPAPVVPELARPAKLHHRSSRV
ncbi:DDHD domain-domain-containing protein [Lobosporangium transversale]|uniref:DDHD domain-domain-containing protein n=1 Tax=Lobosporangium transversale TaxID=64571 RepID=A0A1Y2FY15_9FUNG|nr:DDHD domain-domain-containing protein [Lobosporangium transversale]ORY88916.1 DDHD domain-domain-containing protein [Lobosporangium transversale]|eukprot:XP_021875024.1 DDHD domain-domain-containing protein [Lobosporangium transversale]